MLYLLTLLVGNIFQAQVYSLIYIWTRKTVDCAENAIKTEMELNSETKKQQNWWIG